MVLEYYNGNKLSTRITVDYLTESVSIVNYTDDLIDRAFGINTTPTFEDYENFLESRCFPRTRDHLKIILKDLNLDFYEPIEIIKKTEGRLAEDDMYLKIVEE